MDIIRCNTPEMVEKEITMHLIVYNCIRSLMIQAADNLEILPRLIRFKATIQALRQLHSKPILNEKKLFIDEALHITAPSRAMGKALKYIQNQ